MANALGTRREGNRLTLKRVDAAVADPTKEYTLWDSAITGFGLRVRPTGNKSFVYVYRGNRKKLRRLTIGSLGNITLEQARDQAEALRTKVHHECEDPADVKVIQRSMTFKSAYEEYIESEFEPDSSYKKWTQQRFRAELLPRLGEQPISGIGRSAIRAITDRAKARKAKSEANNIHRAASAFLSWCADRELIAANPIYGIRKPAPNRSRSRVLAASELLKIWHASEYFQAHWRGAIRLLILTGQRKNEVLQARSSEFLLEKGQWHIPSDRSKNERAHQVHLSDLAINVVSQIPYKREQQWLFQSPRRRRGSSLAAELEPMPLSGLTHRIRASREMMDIYPWCVHDIRRSVATHMAELKVAPHVIEVVLNHVGGFRSGVAGVYNRHPYTEEAKEAWALWSQTFENWLKETPHLQTFFGNPRYEAPDEVVL